MFGCIYVACLVLLRVCLCRGCLFALCKYSCLSSLFTVSRDVRIVRIINYAYNKRGYLDDGNILWWFIDDWLYMSVSIWYVVSEHIQCLHLCMFLSSERPLCVWIASEWDLYNCWIWRRCREMNLYDETDHNDNNWLWSVWLKRERGQNETNEERTESR